MKIKDKIHLETIASDLSNHRNYIESMIMSDTTVSERESMILSNVQIFLEDTERELRRIF
jgi:hypothetical protein